MEKKLKTMKLAIVVMALVVLTALPVRAGNLEPSALPSSTMKTLDEVEPRIPIPGSDTPVSVFTISESGSYYLTGNRNCSGIGIQVNADDVTIDLMGYTLIGPDSGTNYGVYMDERSNVEIRNGTIKGFGNYGICEANDTTGKNHRVVNVRAISNGNGGIYLGGLGHLVSNCLASDNGTSSAASVYGIYVNSGSTVIGNTVYKNGDLATGNYVYGIFAGPGCTVTGNTASFNGFAAVNSSVYGIYASTASTVTGNTTIYNGGQSTAAYGLFFAGGNLVDQNTAYGNGMGAGSATEITYGVAGCVYGINVPPAP